MFWRRCRSPLSPCRARYSSPAWLAAAIGCLLSAAPAAAEEKLTGVSRDGQYYRLDRGTVCKPLPVSADGSAQGYPECQEIARRARKAMGFESPARRGGPAGRSLKARLVAARPGDRSPESKTARVDPIFGKPIRTRDNRLAVVAVGADGREEVLAYWAGHPEVVAVEDVFFSRDGRTAVVVYDRSSEALSKVVVSAVGFRLR